MSDGRLHEQPIVEGHLRRLLFRFPSSHLSVQEAVPKQANHCRVPVGRGQCGFKLGYGRQGQYPYADVSKEIPFNQVLLNYRCPRACGLVGSPDT